MTVYLSSDFIMTKEKEQFSNRKWVVDILSYPIGKATGSKVVEFSSSLSNNDKFSRIKFFEKSGIELNIHEVQFWYDANEISDDSLGYLSEFLTPGDVIIGYELSEQTRYLLDKINVTWIDFWLHPVRFLDDILFGFSSSNEDIHNKISEFRIDEEIFKLYANRLKVQFYKGYRRPSINIPDNSALFIGQTLNDKAICSNGRMLNLLDFKEKFEELAKKYDKVYYSRHPYVKKGDEEILKYINEHPSASFIDKPTYSLLASGKIKKVASISSSVVHEAACFGISSEFWYKPVFPVGAGFPNYQTIYQEFISPHFWADILSPILSTKKCDRVMFLDTKDKLRDMLAFYWGYKTVDKVEDIRQTLLAVDRRVQKLSAPKSITESISNINKTKVEKVEPPKILLEKYSARLNQWKKLVDKAEYVSFDVFGTLIERPLSNPNHAFDILDSKLPAEHELKGIFRSEREKARNLITPDLRTCGEEISIDERYSALQQKFKLNNDATYELSNLEHGLDVNLCMPRKSGMDIYNYAVSKNKKIIIISDIFYSSAFVKELLSNANITHYHKLYVSSETHLLKHTGNMFSYVKKDLDIANKNVLHIGDNLRSDIEKAKDHGLNTLHIERSYDYLHNKHPVLKSLEKQDSNEFLTSKSITKSLVSEKIFMSEASISDTSFTAGSAELLGYCVLGPLFSGMAEWLYKQAVSQGLTDLYFLARDGEIIKRAFDKYNHKIGGEKIKSHYLYASRRSVNVAALKTTQDLIDLLSLNFTPQSIGSLLETRFGLSDPNIVIVKEAGYESLCDLADYKKDKDKLQRLIVGLSHDILDNAAHERRNLVKYYSHKGLFSADSVGIVDIGHGGTLQRSISVFLDRPVTGFYFVTSKDIQRNVLDNNMHAYSYFASELDIDKESFKLYQKYILMFENVFLNNQDSFKKIDIVGEDFNPVFVVNNTDKARKEFIEQVHNSIVEFSSDYSDVLSKTSSHFNYVGLSSKYAVTPFLDMLEKPSPQDAMLFSDIEFENIFSGRKSKKLINLNPGDKDSTLAYSLWKEGAIVLFNNTPKPKLKFNLLNLIVRKFSTEKQYHKFLKDPYSFFNDSNNKLISNFKYFYKVS
tara:strand:+ start:4769 stop:8074 length:3306 start_codon:yes stop_codon:yes gene_type:complete